MATGRSRSVPRPTGKSSPAGKVAELTDAQLLERFVALRDERAEQAFSELVARHGPMVLGTCRRMLRDVHAADDAFQAAFLVLARRAGSVRAESLGPWLHGVSYSVAKRARGLAARRRERSGLESDQWEAPVDDLDCEELRTVVDEEVHRLPPAYRAVVILCYLAGLNQEEVARRLRCPVGTVKSRLSRARDLLRHRLRRRGVALMAGLLAPTLASEAAPVAVPPALARSSVHAATQLAAGKAAVQAGTALTGTKALLAVQRDLILTRLRYAGLLLLAAGFATTVALTVWRHGAPMRIRIASRHSVAPIAIRRFAEPAHERRVIGQASMDPPVKAKPPIEGLASPPGGLASRLPTADPRYRSARIQAGRDPDSQIRLALWYEAQGKGAERLKHLTLATLRDPGHVTARGLIGQVAFRGTWCDPDTVADAVRSDEELAARLAEYEARRDKAPGTADAHWSLALWCDRVGLRAQTQAHLTAVTRLDPQRDAAWRRLGYRKVYRRWRTPAQMAADRREPQAQRQADEFWRPCLEMWGSWLSDNAMKNAAAAYLAEVNDPRAVPSICAVFALGDERSQIQAVQILGQVDGPAASRALAVLAIFGSSHDVRRIATDSLLCRDPRDYVGALIGLLRDPITYEVRQVGGSGTPFLFVEGRPFSSRRLLNRPFLPNTSSTRRDPELDWNTAGLERMAPADHWTRAPLARSLFKSTKPARTAEQIVAAQIDLIDRYNSLVREHNASVVRILSNFLAQGLTWTRADWARSWSAELSAGFDPPLPIRIEEGTPGSGAPAIDPPEIPGAGARALRPILGCFGAGTPVRTMLGVRPIESLRLGDRVLAQDAVSGALGFQPILAVCHRPSSPTIRVELGNDSIVVTAIDRFWKPGHGWVMAHDLRRGDMVRTLEGLEAVTALEPMPAQPVFSLEVANSSSFFAGRRAALVHDLTPVEPVRHPFDARWISGFPGGLADRKPGG